MPLRERGGGVRGEPRARPGSGRRTPGVVGPLHARRRRRVGTRCPSPKASLGARSSSLTPGTQRIVEARGLLALAASRRWRVASMTPGGWPRAAGRSWEDVGFKILTRRLQPILRVRGDARRRPAAAERELRAGYADPRADGREGVPLHGRRRARPGAVRAGPVRRGRAIHARQRGARSGRRSRDAGGVAGHEGQGPRQAGGPRPSRRARGRGGGARPRTRTT